jgi:hypothetical protein
MDSGLKLRKTFAVKRGDHKPPQCEHGTWTFAGSALARARIVAVAT